MSAHTVTRGNAVGKIRRKGIMNKSSTGKQQAVDLVYLLKVFRNNLL